MSEQEKVQDVPESKDKSEYFIFLLLLLFLARTGELQLGNKRITCKSVVCNSV